MSEFINWRDEAKKPSKKWADEESGEKIPKEKHENAVLGDGAFLPSDFGMEKIGKDGSKNVRNNTIEPEEFVVAGDDASKKSVNGEIEKGQNNADDNKFASAFHAYIIARDIMEL